MNVLGEKAEEILGDKELDKLKDLVGADFEFCRDLNESVFLLQDRS